MIVFTIQDMSCDGCVASITRAVQKLDPAASVRTDLTTHRVEITSQRSSTELSAAVDDAGYILQSA